MQEPWSAITAADLECPRAGRTVSLLTLYLQWIVHVGAGGGGCPFSYDHWFTSNAAALVIGR